MVVLVEKALYVVGTIKDNGGATKCARRRTTARIAQTRVKKKVWKGCRRRRCRPRKDLLYKKCTYNVLVFKPTKKIYIYPRYATVRIYNVVF